MATGLIVEEALVAESRDYYAHGASAGQIWRDGVRMGRLKTAEGFVDTGGRRRRTARGEGRGMWVRGGARWGCGRQGSDAPPPRRPAGFTPGGAPGLPKRRPKGPGASL